MAVPDFPTDHPLPPREPPRVRTAVLLAALAGPLGLMYTSVGAGMFMLFVLIVLGLFTVGIGIIPVWLLCPAWAYLLAQHANAHHPPAEGPPEA
jgi:hypothetical protein